MIRCTTVSSNTGGNFFFGARKKLIARLDLLPEHKLMKEEDFVPLLCATAFSLLPPFFLTSGLIVFASSVC